MATQLERAGLAAFAGSRWPVLVRVLVLLGAPRPVAQRLAGVATTRLLEGEVSGDHEVTLLAEAVRAWEGEVSWWRAAGASGGGALDGPLEVVLDRLDPATRARLVLTVVGGLAPEQVDEVVPGGPWPEALDPRVARAAASVEPGPPAVAAVELAVDRRRRRRRTTGVVGVLAAAAVVAGVVAVAVDPSPDGSPDQSPSAAGASRPPGAAAELSRVPVRTPTLLVRGDGDAPAPWYDGESVHLGGADDPVVTVPGVRSMTRVADGVVVVREDATVDYVGKDGSQPIGLARDGVVVGSTGSTGVAWLDGDGDLVVARLPPALLERDLPPGARLLFRDGDDTYVALRSGHLVVSDRGGAATRRSGRAPLDAAGGVRLVEGPYGLRVRRPGDVLDLPLLLGDGARLSDDGAYLLASPATSSLSRPTEVVDARTGDVVRLAVPDDGRVLDAAFSGPERITLVLARPDGARFPKRVPRGDLAQPGFDIVTCRLDAGTCESAVQLDAFEAPPLLAH